MPHLAEMGCKIEVRFLPFICRNGAGGLLLKWPGVLS